MNEVKLTIEGLKELTDAVNGLARILTGQKPGDTPITMNVVGQPPIQAAPVAGQTMPMAGQGMNPYAQAPVQQGVPVSQPMQQAAPTQGVPTTAMPQAYTIEQLQVAAAGLANMGKSPLLMGVLQKFGIQAMTELPKERYGEFAMALREAGAQI